MIYCTYSTYWILHGQSLKRVGPGSAENPGTGASRVDHEWSGLPGHHGFCHEEMLARHFTPFLKRRRPIEILFAPYTKDPHGRTRETPSRPVPSQHHPVTAPWVPPSPATPTVIAASCLIKHFSLPKKRIYSSYAWGDEEGWVDDGVNYLGGPCASGLPSCTCCPRGAPRIAPSTCAWPHTCGGG